jgi:GNAT superfamily N-acetyltransferase
MSRALAFTEPSRISGTGACQACETMVTARSLSFLVRLAGPGDRAAIVATVAELLPGMDVAQRHRWLYDENPHGRALTWIARDGVTGQVAGVTSFFPRRIVAQGREVTGAMGGDCYVRPAFRRRGIASALHGAARRDMSRFGIEVKFGTPTPENVTPLAQHRTRNVVELVRYVRPLGAAALGLSSRLDFVARCVLQPRGHGLVLDPFRERDPRVDAIWEQTRAELGIATIRDAEFYDWRFRRSPSQQQRPFVVLDRGRPIAACALERAGRRLRVLDLLAPRRAWPSALTAIAACANECDSVELKLARGDADSRGLWKCGFVARDAKRLNVMIPEGSPHEAMYFDGSRWFWTLSESDIDRLLE